MPAGAGHKLFAKRAALGEPMPFAIVEGAPPAVPFAGGFPLPAGVDEAAYLGALYGEPLKVVRCETVDLDVPAHAEIVIEGHLSVTRDDAEGPFGEVHGYQFGDTSMQPRYTIDASTYRDNPIWPLVVPGRSIDETHTVSGPGIAAEALSVLREASLPITAAWQPLNGACRMLVVTVPQDWRSQLPGVSKDEFVEQIGQAHGPALMT